MCVCVFLLARSCFLCIMRVSGICHARVSCCSGFVDFFAVGVRTNLVRQGFVSILFQETCCAEQVKPVVVLIPPLTNASGYNEADLRCTETENSRNPPLTPNLTASSYCSRSSRTSGPITCTCGRTVSSILQAKV